MFEGTGQQSTLRSLREWSPILALSFKTFFKTMGQRNRQWRTEVSLDGENRDEGLGY